MSFGLYSIGLAIVIGGLIYAAYLVHMPAHWIAVGAAVLLGLGILTGVKATRQKDPVGYAPTGPPHVGHRVTITGVVSNAKMHGMKEDAKAEAKEHGVDKDSTEHGHMTVTYLKMVSETCQK